jgi:hypothetical protein
VDALWARLDGTQWTELRQWSPTHGCKLSWLELGRGIRNGDKIALWAKGFDPLIITFDATASPSQDQKPQEQANKGRPPLVTPANQYSAPPVFQANDKYANQLDDYLKGKYRGQNRQPTWSDRQFESYETVANAKDPCERARHLIHSQQAVILKTAHPMCSLTRLVELDSVELSDGFRLGFEFDYQNTVINP